jgi:hypothetical protein
MSNSTRKGSPSFLILRNNKSKEKAQSLTRSHQTRHRTMNSTTQSVFDSLRLEQVTSPQEYRTRYVRGSRPSPSRAVSPTPTPTPHTGADGFPVTYRTRAPWDPVPTSTRRPPDPIPPHHKSLQTPTKSIIVIILTRKHHLILHSSAVCHYSVRDRAIFRSL